MMVDTNIYGYTVDGGAYHPACTEARPDGNRDDVNALYYLHDEDPHGTTCDGCSDYIFQPVDQHTTAPDGTCEYGCFHYCGDTESCWLHGAVVFESIDDRQVDPLDTLWGIEATGYPVEEE